MSEISDSESENIESEHFVAVCECRVVPCTDPSAFWIYGNCHAKWRDMERVTKESFNKYKKIPDMNLFTDGEEIYRFQIVSQKTKLYHPITNKYLRSGTQNSGIRVIQHVPQFKVVERLYNGQPTLYWVCNNGIMIPKGVITAVCFLGPKPPGHGLQYIDGDYQNTDPTNLRWVIKTKPNGSVRYVTYDKSKKRYRVTCPTLPRKCFKTQDEAVAWLKSQQVTITYIDNSDNKSDPGIIIPPRDDISDESDDDSKIIHL